MFGNTVTINTKTLVKINQDGYASKYRYGDASVEYTLVIRHQKTKGTAEKPVMDRHNVEVTLRTYGTNGAADTVEKSYIVVEQLPSDTAITCPMALLGWLAASDAAALHSLLAWES